MSIQFIFNFNRRKTFNYQSKVTSFLRMEPVNPLHIHQDIRKIRKSLSRIFKNRFYMKMNYTRREWIAKVIPKKHRGRTRQIWHNTAHNILEGKCQIWGKAPQMTESMTKNQPLYNSLVNRARLYLYKNCVVNTIFCVL